MNLNTADKKVIKQGKKNLIIFKKELPRLFEELFVKNVPIKYRGELLNELSEIGLVNKQDGEWCSQYLITELGEVFIVTDNFLLPEKDRVFPLSEDESIYFANKINFGSNENILDIGTGSGIYALLLAKKAKHIVATDINDKALSYAYFNTVFNDLTHKIELIKSDVYDNISNERFDRIISNPAIIPTPRGSEFFIHSDGGSFGTDMSYKILEKAFLHLKPKGKLQMLCTSFENPNNELMLIKIIREIYSDLKFKFSIQKLYNPPLEPISNLLEHFKNVSNYNEYETALRIHTFMRLHYLYVEGNESTEFNLIENPLIEPFNLDTYNGSWTGRLARLFLVYDRMSNGINKNAITNSILEPNLYT